MPFPIEERVDLSGIGYKMAIFVGLRHRLGERDRLLVKNRRFSVWIVPATIIG
jgi:hypothetical protein